MITAIDEAQLAQRRKTRSAASGPVFSVPSLPGVADLQPIAPPPVSAGPVCPAPAASPVATHDLTAFLGRAVGSGQCVALVQAATPALGHTGTWVAGAPVQGDLSLRPGTPIATFDRADRYGNALDGSSHAAIYLGQDRHGMQVLDQWAGSPAAVRTIPWDNPGAAAANTGSAFRVVRSG